MNEKAGGTAGLDYGGSCTCSSQRVEQRKCGHASDACCLVNGDVFGLWPWPCGMQVGHGMVGSWDLGLEDKLQLAHYWGLGSIPKLLP